MPQRDEKGSKPFPFFSRKHLNLGLDFLDTHGRTLFIDKRLCNSYGGLIPSGTRVIEISLTALVAGTKYRGEFEERMEAVVREASVEPKPILFIDEIHLLLDAGWSSGSMDAANILKPALARGLIRVIDATTQVEEKSRGEAPRRRTGAGRPSHNAAAGRSNHVELRVGREEIAAVVAARCGIPVGTLTADEGERLKRLEELLYRR